MSVRRVDDRPFFRIFLASCHGYWTLCSKSSMISSCQDDELLRVEKVVESVVVRSPFCRMVQVEMPRLRRPWLLPVVPLARRTSDRSVQRVH